jgi:sulfatase modifying factor 1
MALRLYKILLLCFLPAPWLCAQDTAITNSIGMKFILIRPGSMIVGRFQPTVSKTVQTPDSIYKLALEMAKRDAMPGFKVSIDYSFYMAQFEVTQEQWGKVMDTNPSYFKGDKVKDDAGQHPVENVSWKDAQIFIRRLNELEKGKAVYRLPTEFEWEYAARAGAEDDISWGDIFKSAVIATNTTSMVGKKKPNAWGLYDMLGNVWEWVQDPYNEKIFADPIPPKKGNEHVLKGASFYGDVKNATYMTHAAGPASKYDVGFRIVMEVK